MARRREVGTGPRVDESVDMGNGDGGERRAVYTIGQVCTGPTILNSVRCEVLGRMDLEREDQFFAGPLWGNCRTGQTLFGCAL
jgi:hypothetical protein